MHQRNMNIYASCRHAAGLTQEAAAELLDCAVRPLAAWEAGTCLPPDDKVMVMCRAYGTPILAADTNISAMMKPYMASWTISPGPALLTNECRGFSILAHLKIIMCF